MKDLLKKRKRVVLLSMSVFAKLLVSGFILVACSESVTNVPTKTSSTIATGIPNFFTVTATAATALTTTPTTATSVAITPAAVTPIATTVPASTAATTSPVSEVNITPAGEKNPVLAIYPNSRLVDISEVSVPRIVAPRGYYPLLEPTFKVLVVVDEPLKVYDFYKQNFTEQGFRPGSDSKSTDHSFSYLFYMTGDSANDVLAIVMGPFDQSNLAEVIKDAPELAGKIKLGDTLIVLASGIS